MLYFCIFLNIPASYKKFNLTSKKLFFLVGLFFVIGCGNSKHKIEINSSPDLANAYIDDELIGLTPIQINLSNGVYAIKIEKKNYFPYLSTFDITSNEVFKFNLKKYTKEVLLKYNLKPDLFFINGRQIKPEKKLILPIGRVDIFAYKKNHPFIKKSVEIELIKASYLKINFVERKGGAQVEIDSLPPGAKVFLDGVKIGKTPVKFNNLYSGKYQWQLKMPGYKDEFIGVGLKKKEKRSFKVKLTRDKFQLELIISEKGKINLYDTNRKMLLSTDVDKSGVNIKLPSSKYLIEYFQGENSFLKEITLLSNTSVLIPRQKKMDFIEVPMEGIVFGELLFAVSDEEKIYFVDAEKGVFDSSKNIYLPKVFMSDWKNCFIAENKLYLCDSLHVYKGSLKKKSDWQEIYQAPNGFIKAAFPINGGILVLSQSGDWVFLSVDGDKTKREIPWYSLKKEIDFEGV